jgi:hypothetical protein
MGEERGEATIRSGTLLSGLSRGLAGSGFALFRQQLGEGRGFLLAPVKGPISC